MHATERSGIYVVTDTVLNHRFLDPRCCELCNAIGSSEKATLVANRIQFDAAKFGYFGGQKPQSVLQ
jgi:hypothetical protein